MVVSGEAGTEVALTEMVGCRDPSAGGALAKRVVSFGSFAFCQLESYSGARLSTHGYAILWPGGSRSLSVLLAFHCCQNSA